MNRQYSPLGTTPPSVAVIQRTAGAFLTALKNRDWSLFESLLSPECYWTLPGTNVVSGEAIGPKAVTQKAQTIVSFAVSMELQHILYGRHGFGLLIRNRATREERTLDETLVAVCNLKEGLICSINTYLHDVPMMDGFFPKSDGQ